MNCNFVDLKNCIELEKIAPDAFLLLEEDPATTNLKKSYTTKSIINPDQLIINYILII